jgi:hypothetical protein
MTDILYFMKGIWIHVYIYRPETGELAVGMVEGNVFYPVHQTL